LHLQKKIRQKVVHLIYGQPFLQINIAILHVVEISQKSNWQDKKNKPQLRKSHPQFDIELSSGY
jgi:hypothetical protein